MNKFIRLSTIILFLCIALNYLPANADDNSLVLATAANNLELPEKITIDDVIEIGLSRNRDLETEKLNLTVDRAQIERELADFDYTFGLDFDASARREEETYEAEDRGDVYVTRRESESFSAGLDRQFFDGTTLGLDFSSRRTETTRVDERFRSQVGLDLRRPLLQDAGREITQLSVNQAEKDLEISEHQLRGFVSSLVRDLKEHYWNFFLAHKQLQVHEDALELAREQLQEVKKRIDVGTLPQLELAAAEADMARQKERLIDARTRRDLARLELLHLMNIDPDEKKDNPQPATSPQPEVEELSKQQQLLEYALTHRPELDESLLRLENQELNVVRTANGLLPRLDFFVNLGQTGFANSFSRSIDDLDGDNYSLSGGLNFEYSFGNRAAESQHEQAETQKEQQQLALANLRDLVTKDVRSSNLEVERARRQVEATEATRHQNQRALEAELTKLAHGRSTSRQVASARQDLTESELSVLEAHVDLNRAHTALLHHSAQLLSHQNIQLP